MENHTKMTREEKVDIRDKGWATSAVLALLVFCLLF